MCFWQMIIADAIGGIISGLIVAIGVYFIFDKILIKRPKVRLYIEPNGPKLDNEGKFILKFYLHNIGNANAKNVLLTIEFDNLEIVEIPKGNFKRIDKHRGDTPSVQLDLGERVLHPRREIRNFYIGEILFKLKKPQKEIEIEYDLVADDMKFFKDAYRIRPKLKK